MNKLTIANEMANLDSKNRDFYNSLSEEEQKKFSVYLMLRWGSCVESSPEIEAYYLLSTNQNLNMHFFDISNHPNLQWLCASSISPGIGNMKHTWISHKKKSNVNNKTIKFLKEIYPNYKDDEIETLGRLNSKDDIKRLARDFGWSDDRIKKEL